MGVIVDVYLVFGLTVSDSNTEINHLRTERMSKSTAIFRVEAAD